MAGRDVSFARGLGPAPALNGGLPGSTPGRAAGTTSARGPVPASGFEPGAPALDTQTGSSSRPRSQGAGGLRQSSPAAGQRTVNPRDVSSTLTSASETYS